MPIRSMGIHWLNFLRSLPLENQHPSYAWAVLSHSVVSNFFATLWIVAR